MHEAEEEGYPGARIPARLDEHEVVNSEINNAQRNGRLDQARRRIEHVQRGERQGYAVGDGEGGDDGQQPRQASSHQQQPHDKEDVIRAGEDVIDPEGDELFHDGQRDLPAAAKVVEGRMVFIEDFLTSKQPLFMNVEEGLVLRFVGKERALYSERSRKRLSAEAQMQRHCLPIGQWFNALQLQIERLAVSRQQYVRS